MIFKSVLNKTQHLFCVVFLFLGLLSGNDLFAQNGDFSIKGSVVDENGIPLPGVNIIEKGTSNGVNTDFDGLFAIRVNSGKSVLVFSFVGYKTTEVPVNGKKDVKVIMNPSAESLDEVVVIGYGSVRKSDLTGSVSSMSGDKLDEIPVNNVAEALSGRMAGVQVTSAEGSPDSEVSIRIRGGGSITQDSSPLIIVDGFPVNSMGDISPSNIADITVLKDASSTAIYGSRGANGVIIITTKKGKDGKIDVNFNSFYGMKNIANKIDVQSVEDYVKWQYEYALLRNDNEPDSYEEYFGQWMDYDQYIGMKGNNWQEQIYGNQGSVQTYDLGVRGGSEKVNFNFNYGFYDEKTIMDSSDFKRNNLALALKSKPHDKVNLSFTVRYNETEINGGGANEQNEVSSADARLRHSVGYAPIPLPGLTTDDTDEALSSYLVNPFVAVDDNQRQQMRKNFNTLGSFEWDVFDNFTFKTDLGLDNYYYLDYRFYGRSTYYANNKPSAENQGLPALMIRDTKRQRFRNANTINYDFENLLGDDHSLKVLVGQEYIFTETSRITTEMQGFPKFFGFETAKSLTTQATPNSVDNFYSPDDKLLSFFTRVNYGFKNKYLLTATMRADGSSKFLGDNIWGYFPSAAAAWKISEEEFMNDVNWVNNLKLRLSYGQAGNNRIPAGQTVQNFVSRNTTYINDVSSYWAASNTMANPDLKWETTTTMNAGLDFDLFDRNIVTGTLDVYKNITSDLLINFPTPGTGYTSQYRNMGETENTGVEATLNIMAIENSDYGLNFSLNAGWNKNKVNSLGVMDDFGINTNWASTQIGNDYVVRVGESLGLMYGYQNDGRYEVSDFDYDATSGDYTLKSDVADATAIVGTVRPGTMKLKDIDGDGLVTVDDNSVIGNAYPTLTGGFNINARVKNFDFTAIFNYSIGNDVYNANKVEFTTSNDNGQFRNLSSTMADGQRWTNLDPTSGQLVTDPTQLAAMNESTTMWSPYMSRYVFSDWAVEDGSFMRLSTATLGYTLPDSVLNRLKVSNLRLYVTGQNLFVVTNYSGLDPEVSTRRKTPLTPGVDYSPFPRSRQVIFGLNLSF